MLEMSAKMRDNGEGIHVLEGLGWEGWRVVGVPGGWGVGENSLPKAREFPSSPMAQSLILADLSNIESGGSQAANNNSVGWKL